MPRRTYNFGRRGAVSALAARSLLAIFVLGIFVIDVALPSGRATIPLTLVAVILSGRIPGRRNVLYTASACAALIVLEYFARHGSAFNAAWVGRRASSFFAIWIGAYLTIRNQKITRLEREKTEILDQAADALFVRNAAGLITYWNRSCEALYGWRRDEAIGRDAGMLGATPLQAAEQEVRRAGKWSGELQQRNRAGQVLTVSSHWTCRFDEAGNASEILQRNTDITEAKAIEAEIERNKSRYQGIFESVAAAVWEVDPSFLVRYINEYASVDALPYFAAHPDVIQAAIRKIQVIDVNEAALELFDASRERDRSESFCDILQSAPADFAAFFLSALVARNAFHERAVSLKTLTGYDRSVLVSVSFFVSESYRSSALVSMMDVTDRVVAAQKLRGIREAITKAVRTRTLNALALSIERDIEQPIGNITMLGRQVVNELDTADGAYAPAETLLKQIAEEGRSAGDVIRKIQGFLKRSPPEYVAFALHEAVAEAGALVQSSLTRNGVGLQCEVEAGLPPVMGDRTGIAHVFVHFMLRGIKGLETITAEGKVLMVKVFRCEDEVRVLMQDNVSPGAPDGLERLFLQEQTSGEMQADDDGVAVSWAVIEAHGGKVWNARKDGQVTAICLALPAYFG